MNILQRLKNEGAVITDSHLVFTSGKHSDSYIDMRVMAHDSQFWDEVGKVMAELLRPYNLDVLVGPETLGRTIACATARHLRIPVFWCDIENNTEGAGKVATFPEKLNFPRLIEPGMKAGSIDDLLSTGVSVAATNTLIEKSGMIPVVTGVVVRRTSSVGSSDVGSKNLEVLQDVPDFAIFTPEECAKHGPCSKRKPMVQRPGHGHTWSALEENIDFPKA